MNPSTVPNPMWGKPTRLSVYPTHCADAQAPIVNPIETLIARINAECAAKGLLPLCDESAGRISWLLNN